jgi:hypothetical protein
MVTQEDGGDSLDANYLTLLGIVSRLIQSQAGKTIAPSKEHLADAQALALKLFGHFTSLRIVARETSLHLDDDTNFHLIDHSSAKVIARAALETYLVLVHVFDDTDLDLSAFRYKAWRLGGLADRQNLHRRGSLTNVKLDREKQELDLLESQLQTSLLLSKYKPKQAKQLLRGDWRVGITWADMAVSAGFSRKFFEDIYGYLCGYSHSSYASAMQVRAADSLEEQRELTKSLMYIGAMLMAQFSEFYMRLFEGSHEAVSKNSAFSEVIKKWRSSASLIGPMYEC